MLSTNKSIASHYTVYSTVSYYIGYYVSYTKFFAMKKKLLIRQGAHCIDYGPPDTGPPSACCGIYPHTTAAQPV